MASIKYQTGAAYTQISLNEDSGYLNQTFLPLELNMMMLKFLQKREFNAFVMTCTFNLILCTRYVEQLLSDFSHLLKNDIISEQLFTIPEIDAVIVNASQAAKHFQLHSVLLWIRLILHH